MDISLYYEEYGKGFPLVLLHGNGEELHYFDKQIEYFSASFRVIAVDTRGHGRSPRGSAPFTIRQFADDLKALLNSLNVEKANILGFSDGGNIALVFAMKYPDMVARLVLNGANLCSSGVKASVQLPIILGYKIASLFASKSEKAKRNAEMLGLMVNDPNIDPKELVYVKAKTLVIAGTSDMIKRKHTELISQGIPDSTLAFASGDHFIASKNPKEFNDIVGKFLEVKAI